MYVCVGVCACVGGSSGGVTLSALKWEEVYLLKTINGVNIPFEVVHMGLGLKNIWG